MQRRNRNSPTEQPSRAIAYIRVSTDKQAEKGTSLEAQRAQIEAYAALYGISVIEFVVDGGHSGKSLQRPGFQKVLQSIQRGEADALIVTKLDRLTRSVRDLAALMDRYFAKGRVGLLSVGEQVDTRSATGRMVLNVICTIGQWERERIGERVSDMHAVKRARHERVGHVPYGMQLAEDGRSLISNDHESAVIQRVLDMRSRGHSIASIAGALNADGVPARGKKWHPTSVARIASRSASS